MYVYGSCKHSVGVHPSEARSRPRDRATISEKRPRIYMYNTCIYIYIYEQVVCIHICAYTYIYIYVYTYIYIYMYAVQEEHEVQELDLLLLQRLANSRLEPRVYPLKKLIIQNLLYNENIIFERKSMVCWLVGVLFLENEFIKWIYVRERPRVSLCQTSS